MRDGYYLSTYYSTDRIGNLYDLLSSRHDMAIALWKKKCNSVDLVRYWEFERLSRLKHHKLPFFDEDMANREINRLLNSEGLNNEDIIDIWGTAEKGEYEIRPNKAFYSHGIYHLFSSMMIDTDIFYNNKIIALAVDLRADNDNETRNDDGFPEYVGCYSDCGKINYFNISSPAILWNICRNEIGLQEGSLMALASACKCRLINPLNLAINEMTWPNYKFGYEVFDLIRNAINPESVCNIDSAFSLEDNLISALMKEVIKISNSIMESELSRIIHEFKLAPNDTYLAISGGYGLNCPSNSLLMKKYGFKGFVGAPCMDDSGEALGIGLYNFYSNLGKFDFKLNHAFYGKRYVLSIEQENELTEQGIVIESSPLNYDVFVEDITHDVVVWFDGAAEIGPRALGHRSILGDPRSLEVKDRLNTIKKRQFWRPVAPIVLKDYVCEWFEDDISSPFMLHTSNIFPDKRDLVPAIVHYDGTARLQTIEDKPYSRELYNLLVAFFNKTNIPMLCNTSLNDKGEPIINCPEDAINFAMKKRIEIVYINGVRYKININSLNRTIINANEMNPWVSSTDREKYISEENPLGLERKVLLWKDYFGFDIKNEEQAKKLKRSVEIIYKYHPEIARLYEFLVNV